MKGTVRPRDAATLVVWRESSSGVEVLMGRRAARHRFVPGHYVFPGGRVDRGDFGAEVRSPLTNDVQERLCASCKPRLAHALAVAAVRETWEETGLALGEVSGGALRADLGSLDYVLRAITPPQSPIRFHARFFAVAAGRLCGRLEGNGELLDLAFRPAEACLRLPIVDVTEFLLRRLLVGPPAAAGSGDVALFSFRRGVSFLRCAG